jgi:hypothetical protein
MAAPAYGAIGDVISSFPMSRARNIYRDENYVYCVAGTNTLRQYTVNGSLVRTVSLPGLTNAGDADHSPLGPAYFGVLERSNRIFEFRLATGSFVRSRAVGASTVGYAHFPGSPYFYTHTGARIMRYTVAGSLVSSFDVSYSATVIAATRRFNDAGGEFVLVANRSTGRTAAYTGAGSLVRYFNVPGPAVGAVCGPGTGYTPKTRYWCTVPAGSDRFAYEIDLGNVNVAVEPASWGSVKALFR